MAFSFIKYRILGVQLSGESLRRIILLGTIIVALVIIGLIVALCTGKIMQDTFNTWMLVIIAFTLLDHYFVSSLKL